MIKKIIYLFLLALLLPFNINDASQDDWDKISSIISEEKINLIKVHLLLNGHIDNIYELIEIDGIDILDIDTLKPLISIEASDNNSLLKRTSYKLENWLSS